jgi:hypothetical protein
MYTKQDFVNSFSNNTRILKHLAAKIPAGKADFRPSLAQRSVLELMQYLSSSARATCDAILQGNPRHTRPQIKERIASNFGNVSSILYIY